MCLKKLQAEVDFSEEKEIPSKNLNGMRLEYYIVENDIEPSGKSYGIEIIKKEYTNNDGTYMENIAINDICCSEKNVKIIINKLVDYRVTPITVTDVIEDMVGVV